jgi:hypothetical protein
MGKGKKKKNRGSSYYQAPIKTRYCELEYLAQIAIKGTATISESALDKLGGDLDTKIREAIKDTIRSKFPNLLAIEKVGFRTKDKQDGEFLSMYAQKELEKQQKKEEEEHVYIGQIVCGKKKKMALFQYPEIKESWRQQRDIWDTWKEFVRVFLDDIEDPDEVDVEEGDIDGSYTIPEELDIRKKLLRDFTDDMGKLGFKKKEEEPQTD